MLPIMQMMVQAPKKDEAETYVLYKDYLKVDSIPWLKENSLQKRIDEYMKENDGRITLNSYGLIVEKGKDGALSVKGGQAIYWLIFQVSSEGEAKKISEKMRKAYRKGGREEVLSVPEQDGNFRNSYFHTHFSGHELSVQLPIFYGGIKNLLDKDKVLGQLMEGEKPRRR